MSATPCELLQTLRGDGFSLSITRPGVLTVMPASRLTDPIRALIREHKRDILHALEAANDQIVTSGTRRPDGLTPKLLAASLALDRQILEAGYTLELPPEPQSAPVKAPPQIKVEQPASRLEQPRRKPDHFDVHAPWRASAKAYYAHHVICPLCQAAGRGDHYGQRCGVGIPLWTQYAKQESAQNMARRCHPRKSS